MPIDGKPPAMLEGIFGAFAISCFISPLNSEFHQLTQGFLRLVYVALTSDGITVGNKLYSAQHRKK